ncbi:MAG: LuxR C-terminal-related transcriptional regulator [bacterium]
MPEPPGVRPTLSPLLEAKFHAPRVRDSHVIRDRLLKRLAAGSRGKLTLLSAPPGFGKTTLLAGWLARRTERDGPVAWLSLEESDNHPALFWRYLFGALSKIAPGVDRSGVLVLLDTAQAPPIETLVTLLVNEITSSSDPVTLVLDDYHFIDAPAIESGMLFLLEHIPAHMHVVIASRADPALPLPRLRTRGELTEIRAADLRFSLAEAGEFLNGTMSLDLTDHDLERLETRTEGWPGALQLAALSLQGREHAGFISEFSGNDRFVMDYLVEEVLRRQPGDVREFLLKTSVLERLAAPLCDAVLGQSDSGKMLESLERSNLFIVPLDDRREWFRYHQLFSDVLQVHLLAEHPDEGPQLHERASEWYANNGEPERAIRHALAARNLPRAAGLIELQARNLVHQHHPDQLIQWLRLIPADIVRTMPVLSLYYGHALQGMGDLEKSAARLDEAERALMASPPGPVFDHDSYALLPALIAVGRGYLAMAARDAETTRKHATEALALFPSVELHWRGTAVSLLSLAHWIEGDLDAAQSLHSQAVKSFEQAGDDGLAITSGYHDSELLKARGRLDDAKRQLEASLRSSLQRGAGARGAANLHLGLSELCSERNDFEGARKELEGAQRLGIYPPRTPFRYCLAQAKLLQAEGDIDGALSLLDEAERLQVRGAVPDYRPVAAWRARLLVLAGRLEEALNWAHRQGLSPDDEPSYTREYEHITLARILLARPGQGDIASAVGLLDRLLADAEAGGRNGTVIEIRALLAIARAMGGDADAAVRSLAPALIAAAPEGYARVFVDEGELIAPLLRTALSQGIVPEYCGRLLGILSEPPAPSGAHQNSADSLSERELEVLRLLASELSGPEIANTIFVSLNTLRTHTKNIYSKLGANTRRSAVRRAFELGLI